MAFETYDSDDLILHPEGLSIQAGGQHPSQVEVVLTRAEDDGTWVGTNARFIGRLMARGIAQPELVAGTDGYYDHDEYYETCQVLPDEAEAGRLDWHTDYRNVGPRQLSRRPFPIFAEDGAKLGVFRWQVVVL